MSVFIAGLFVGLIAGVFCTTFCCAASDMEKKNKKTKIR